MNARGFEAFRANSQFLSCIWASMASSYLDWLQTLADATAFGCWLCWTNRSCRSANYAAWFSCPRVRSADTPGSGRPGWINNRREAPISCTRSSGRAGMRPGSACLHGSSLNRRAPSRRRRIGLDCFACSPNAAVVKHFFSRRRPSGTDCGSNCLEFNWMPIFWRRACPATGRWQSWAAVQRRWRNWSLPMCARL